jgi:bifunctional DNA-binding transcriptional regulator/antitoxin component of YhaV-PrlF toxin-antitoxin module
LTIVRRYYKVINMDTDITITRKGQTTIPVALRRRLGLGPAGGKLHLTLDAQRNRLIISKPVSIEEFSRRVSRYIKPGTKPVLDADRYYQEHRTTQ